MSREKLPTIGSHRSKAAANRQKRRTQSSSSSKPHAAPPSVLLVDTSVAPWGGGTLLKSSFATVPLPPPPPTPPPAPRPTPSSAPYRGRPRAREKGSSASLPSGDAPLNGAAPQDQDGAGAEDEGSQVRRRGATQRRPPRLPPLHPVTNLSFSRSFTFSFFELPLHHSPRCRAERTRNLMLLLKQIHF